MSPVTTGRHYKKSRASKNWTGCSGYLLEHFDGNTYIAVSGDHSTPVLAGDHTGEPVPIVVWGPHVRTDAVATFGERPSARGNLGRVSGKDVMKLLTSLTMRQDKFGA